MSFQHFLMVLRARRRLALGVVAAVLVMTIGVSLLLTKKYTASASVVVDVKTDPVGDASSQVDEAYLGTQVTIASSPRVAQRVVKILKLDESPEYRQRWLKSTDGRGEFAAWIATDLVKRLSVKPSSESNVIELSAKWPDAKGAAAVANAFAQAYIETNLALRVEPARQNATWFNNQSNALRAELESKQKVLSDFEEKEGIVATDEKLDVESARLNELSAQLVQIEAQRQDSQSRQRQIEGDPDAIPEVLQSPVITSLKAELSSLEAKQSDIRSRFGLNHPEYKSIDAAINSARQRLIHERSEILASLDDATKVNLRRERDVSDAIEAQKQLLLKLKHDRDRVAILQSDVQTAQRNLDAVSQRSAQMNLESQTRQSNVLLLSPATEPLVASSPNYLILLPVSLVLGTLLGLFAVLVAELIRPRARSDQQIVDILGVPILGRVRSMRPTAQPAAANLKRLEAPAG